MGDVIRFPLPPPSPWVRQVADAVWALQQLPPELREVAIRIAR